MSVVGRAGWTHVLVGLALCAGSAIAGAQTEQQSGGDVALRPFAVGERLVYSVKVGPIGHGNAVAELRSIDTLRGRTVYHSVFTMNGSLLFFHVDDEYESWFDPTTLVSLRYRQQIDQGSYERNRTYEIFPDLGIYLEPDKTQRATVDQPLDDGAFLYFLRTMPLKVGKTYTFNRYFKPDRNPVTVTVVRRERIRVPAGEFNAVVLQPKIKAKGIFAEGANAEVWIAEDDGRAVLQMRTHMSFGTVQFQLRSIEKPKLAER
ncbi:MAG TPA: DUF3108 domain-containing protein [Gemmatimonadaceae bacterium]|nr:DUF3108 domain-containing protein [Gemmatimonadaceae bacterium]